MARSRRPAGRRSGAKLPPWALLLIGLAIGALVAWGIHLYLARSAARNAAARAPMKPRAEAPAVASPKLPAPPTPKSPTTKPTPSETRPKPRYDFYTILPEIERVIPDNETRKSKTKTAKVDDTRYILQAASFGAFEEADRLKAKLALSGMEARIEKITIEGKGDYYRVRLGPYATLEQLNIDNKKLRDLGVKAIRLEVKKGPPA